MAAVGFILGFITLVIIVNLAGKVMAGGLFALMTDRYVARWYTVRKKQRLSHHEPPKPAQ